MKRCLFAVAAAMTLTAAVPPARAAGNVAVSFVRPDQFLDIGHSTFDREHALDVLRRHFETLGAKLPEGQTLTVEVLDVDLAGEIQRTPRSSVGEMRILKGGADWPRMTLQYTLTAGGQTVKSGQSKLADMSYMSSGIRASPARTDELYYETRMVDRWFDQNFVPKKAKTKK
jgi:hypothetical protein